MRCLQIRTLQVNKYYFGAFSLAYSFVCVAICYNFALVTKQVTIKVATKVRTNLLCCKWYLTYWTRKEKRTL